MLVGDRSLNNVSRLLAVIAALGVACTTGESNKQPSDDPQPQAKSPREPDTVDIAEPPDRETDSGGRYGQSPNVKLVVGRSASQPMSSGSSVVGSNSTRCISVITPLIPVSHRSAKCTLPAVAR